MSEREKQVILLSAEESSELEQQGYDWIRDATNEEAQKALEANPGVSSTDGIGRPYFWTVIEPHAPDYVWKRASECIRIMRFNNKS